MLPLPLGLAAVALLVLGFVLWRRKMAGALLDLRDHHRTHAPTTGQHNALVVTDIEVGVLANKLMLLCVQMAKEQQSYKIQIV